MKRLLAVALLLVSLPAWGDEGRFQIYDSADNPTMLLDKKTGVVWRNVRCDESSILVANCWQLMGFVGAITPLTIDSTINGMKQNPTAAKK